MYECASADSEVTFSPILHGTTAEVVLTGAAQYKSVHGLGAVLLFTMKACSSIRCKEMRASDFRDPQCGHIAPHEVLKCRQERSQTGKERMMRTRYEKQLEQLNNEMIHMGCLIEKAIESAITALVNQDEELARKIMAGDEEINEQESAIEGLCMKLLLCQQPVATDLRNVSAALKMVTDMERIGDQAADIAEISLLFSGQTYIKKLTHIQEMAAETTEMVVKCMEAFVGRDLNKAQSVIDRDDKVDELFNKVKNELIEMIAVDRSCGEQATDLLMVAKYFERIGDHATNIAEWVIYSITGEHKSQN